MKKKYLVLLLALVLAVGLLPGTAWAADETSGKCGDNVTWSLSNGVLSIDGKGPMDDYDYGARAPWYDSYRWQIRTVVIGDGVTSIGTLAFVSCKSLTGVTIPDSVTSIGESAFVSCTSLTGVTIPDSVTSIGNDAFGNCTSLTEVTIPDSVASIGEGVFSGCTSLTSAVIGDGVTSIGDFAFSGSGLTSVTIPDSVTSIGNSAFDACTSLTDVTIGDGVTSIEQCLFQGCTSLTSVTIGNGVTSIGRQAFLDCASLTSVTMGSNVTSIGEQAFSNCKSLTGVTIPDSVTSIGEQAFRDCTSLTSAVIGSGSIGHSAFWGCTSLADVVIGSGVTFIDGYAFSGCGLTSLTIPDSVTSIEYNAFQNCTSLASVTIGNSVASISTQAFSGCTSLTSVTLGSGIADIGSFAFYGCVNLTSVTIPDSVTYTYISSGAFAGCSSLARVYYGVGEGYIYYGLNVIQVENIAISTSDFLMNDSTYVYIGNNDPLLAAEWHYNSTGPDTAGPEPEKPAFTDVPADAYYAAAVAWAAENGITSGTGNGTTFSPNEPCTRGQIVTFLWRAYGEQEPTITENPFTDVKPSDYYYKAVLWAVEKGITQGTSATTFNPSGTCTRDQAVTFQWRAAGRPAASGGNSFTDVDGTAYYADAVAWAVANGITNGTSTTTFNPSGICDRGQIVTFLYREMGQSPTPTPEPADPSSYIKLAISGENYSEVKNPPVYTNDMLYNWETDTNEFRSLDGCFALPREAQLTVSNLANAGDDCYIQIRLWQLEEVYHQYDTNSYYLDSLYHSVLTNNGGFIGLMASNSPEYGGTVQLRPGESATFSLSEYETIYDETGEAVVTYDFFVLALALDYPDAGQGQTVYYGFTFEK